MFKKSIKFLSLSIAFTLCFAANTVAQSSDEAEKQGKEIYEKYQAAIGGKENIAKIKSSEIIAEKDGDVGKAIKLEIKDHVGKKAYSGTKFESGRLTEAGWDGSGAWLRWDGVSSRLPVTDSGFDPPLKHVKLPNKKIDGKEYLVVEEKFASYSQTTYYDPETFLLFRRDVGGGINDLDGNLISPYNLYSDYRKVGDVLVPHSEKYYLDAANSRPSSTTIVLRVRYNIEIDQSIFELSGTRPKIEKPAE